MAPRFVFATAVALFMGMLTSTTLAALPPDVKKELTELAKELKGIAGLIKKKEVDQAKEIISKTEERLKVLAIAEDEKDRSYASFKTALEKAKNLIPVSFEHEVAPILQANCLRCHGEEQASACLAVERSCPIQKSSRSLDG